MLKFKCWHICWRRIKFFVRKREYLIHLSDIYPSFGSLEIHCVAVQNHFMIWPAKLWKFFAAIIYNIHIRSVNDLFVELLKKLELQAKVPPPSNPSNFTDQLIEPLIKRIVERHNVYKEVFDNNPYMTDECMEQALKTDVAMDASHIPTTIYRRFRVFMPYTSAAEMLKKLEGKKWLIPNTNEQKCMQMINWCLSFAHSVRIQQFASLSEDIFINLGNPEILKKILKRTQNRMDTFEKTLGHYE